MNKRLNVSIKVEFNDDPLDFIWIEGPYDAAMKSAWTHGIKAFENGWSARAVMLDFVNGNREVFSVKKNG